MLKKINLICCLFLWCEKFSHAMAEDVDCCCHMMDNMVLSQASFCGIWVAQCGCGTGLCLRVYPYHYYSSCAPYIYIIHLPLALYNFSPFGWCSVIHFSLSWYKSTDKLHYGVLCYFKQQFYIH